jgi:hypothetical protein
LGFGCPTPEEWERVSAKAEVVDLGGGITGTRAEDVWVSSGGAHRHHVAGMFSEYSDGAASLDVPEVASGVSRGSEDGMLIDEAT